MHEITAAQRGSEAGGIHRLAPAPPLPRLREALPGDLRDRLPGKAAGDLTRLPRGALSECLDAPRRGEAAAPERT